MKTLDLKKQFKIFVSAIGEEDRSGAGSKSAICDDRRRDRKRLRARQITHVCRSNTGVV